MKLNIFKIEDILKAAIKDAGLESNLHEILNDTPPNSSSGALTINTSTSMHDGSTNDFMGDDDFNLNDLDFSILNAITPPHSTSPSSSSVSSNSNASSLHHHHHTNNHLIPDDSDPFLMAIKELDESNSKIQVNLQPPLQNEINSKPMLQPTFKVVSINNVSCQNKTNNSDLLSLLSYRTSNPSGKTLDNLPNTKLLQVIFVH